MQINNHIKLGLNISGILKTRLFWGPITGRLASGFTHPRQRSRIFCKIRASFSPLPAPSISQAQSSRSRSIARSLPRSNRYSSNSSSVHLDQSRTAASGNGFIESQNGKSAAVWLNTYWFLSIDEPRRNSGPWCRRYNEVLRQGDIGNKAPIKLNSSARNSGRATEE